MPRRIKTEEEKAITPLTELMDSMPRAVEAYNKLVDTLREYVTANQAEEQSRRPEQQRQTTVAMIAQYSQLSIARGVDAYAAELEAEVRAKFAQLAGAQ